MRAIATVLSIAIALALLTSVSYAKCVEQQASVAQKAKKGQSNSVAVGYEPVKVLLAAAREDRAADVKTVAETRFRFAIDGIVPVRFDGLRYTVQVHHCTFGSGTTGPKEQKTFVNVWYHQVPSTDDLEHGVSWILIPKTTVAAMPAVGLELTSGTEVSGVWGSAMDGGRRVATITIAPVE